MTNISTNRDFSKSKTKYNSSNKKSPDLSTNLGISNKKKFNLNFNFKKIKENSKKLKDSQNKLKKRKNPLNNYDEFDNSYGFWTSRTVKTNNEDLMKEIISNRKSPVNFNLKRKDYFNSERNYYEFQKKSAYKNKIKKKKE